MSKKVSVFVIGIAAGATVALFYVAVSVRNKHLGLILLPALVAAAVVTLPVSVRAIVRGARSIVRYITWWQVIFVLCFLSGVVWRVRTLQDINSEPLDMFALLRIALQATVTLVLLMRLFDRRTDWVRPLFTGVIGIVALYPILSLVSTTWSVKPGWTLYKSVEYLVDLSTMAAIVISIKSIEDYERLTNIAWTLLGLLLSSAWIGALIDPTDALKLSKIEGPLTGRLNGICPQIDANSVGEWSAMLAVVALGRILYDPEKRFGGRWYKVLFIASIVTLIYSQTRGAIAGFAVATLVLLWLSRRIGLGIGIVLAGLPVFGALLISTNAGHTLFDFITRGQSIQSIQDVSGRMDWWHYAVFKFWQRPLTGYGGYAGGRFVVLAGIGRYDTGDLLSSWVQPLIDLGLIGFVTLVSAIMYLWYTLISCVRTPFTPPTLRRMLVEVICIMTIVQIRSFFTGNLITHDAMPFLIVLGCAEVCRRFVKVSTAKLGISLADDLAPVTSAL